MHLHLLRDTMAAQGVDHPWHDDLPAPDAEHPSQYACSDAKKQVIHNQIVCHGLRRFPCVEVIIEFQGVAVMRNFGIK